MDEFRCPLCGAALVTQEPPREARCLYCGTVEASDLLCPAGHYTCEACRLADSKQLLSRYLDWTAESNVLVLLETVLKHPAFPINGREHHFVLGAVVAAALRNRGELKRQRHLAEAIVRRTESLPYGGCGSMGVCGACASAGALLSRLLRAGFRSDEERARVLETTSAALAAVANAGGPRCCKQSVYLTLRILQDRLERWLGIDLGVPQRWACVFWDRNPECKREDCEFFVPPGQG